MEGGEGGEPVTGGRGGVLHLARMWQQEGGVLTRRDYPALQLHAAHCVPLSSHGLQAQTDHSPSAAPTCRNGSTVKHGQLSWQSVWQPVTLRYALCGIAQMHWSSSWQQQSRLQPWQRQHWSAGQAVCQQGLQSAASP